MKSTRAHASVRGPDRHGNACTPRTGGGKTFGLWSTSTCVGASLAARGTGGRVDGPGPSRWSDDSTSMATATSGHWRQNRQQHCFELPKKRCRTSTNTRLRATSCLVWHTERRAIVLTVEDDGAGFLPSTRVPSEQGGFGLLIMAERSTHSRRRDVEISSHPGHGTVVRATLPYALRRSSARVKAPVTAAKPVTASQRPIRCPGRRQSHHRAPRYSTHSGRQTPTSRLWVRPTMALLQLNKPHHLRPDVILLDVQMPRLSGIEALPQLRTVVSERRGGDANYVQPR